MSRGILPALIGTAALAAAAVAQQPARSWVEMTSGTSNRAFLDTASIAGKEDSLTAQVMFIDKDGRQVRTLGFKCSSGQYRLENGAWQDDDRANVKRTCERNFRGLTLLSAAEVNAIPLVQGAVRPLATAPGKWILVDWTIDEMVLVDPATIKKDPKGWRFNAIVQYAGSERFQRELVADCANKRAFDEQQARADEKAIKDDPIGAMFGLMARGMNRTPLNVVTYVAFCMERPPQLHDAPGVDLAEALRARDQFEADLARYLRARPGADVSKAINMAPGPKEQGGYQLSLMDIILPTGLRSEIVGAEQNRTVVQQTWKHPFSAVGHLFIRKPKGWGACTATLVGNNRTVLTAAHCGGGTGYYFAPGNSGRETAIPARIVASGDFPMVPGKESLDAGPRSSPNPDWDDWMVLDLERPSPGEPLSIPTQAFIDDTIRRFRSPYFHVAGFPGDVKDGELMTYSRGCGTHVSALDYKKARTSKTGCSSYKGSSGSALLVLTPQHRYVPVGILSGGDIDGEDTSYSILTIGSRAFDAIRSKVAAECRAKPAGVRFHPQACAQKGGRAAAR